MTKVTVLVAVYNAAPYLQACLDSLSAQTLRDIQVVCIDDASTDHSLQLLQRHAAADPRFQVVSLPQNGGQAHARNEGLRLARGQYVCMLDADDWYGPDALQQAVSVMEGCDEVDCVLFSVQNEYADHSEPYAMQPFVTLSGAEAFRLSLTWQIHGIYMVRAHIHHRYPYDETCRLYSDDNTTRMHYLASRRVGLCRGVYHYRQHAASATHVVSVRQFDYLLANASMRRQLQEAGVDGDLLAVYENHRWLNVVGVYMFLYVHGRELAPHERAWGLEQLHQAWLSIDRSALSPSLTRKLGYRPMPTWPLFRAQEWLYFTLRALLGKNR